MNETWAIDGVTIEFLRLPPVEAGPSLFAELLLIFPGRGNKPQRIWVTAEQLRELSVSAEQWSRAMKGE